MKKVLAELSLSNNGVVQIIFDPIRDDKMYLRLLRTGEIFGMNIPVNDEILKALYNMLKHFYGDSND